MIKTTFEYSKFKFPAGEKQIRIISELKLVETIIWKYENDEELFEIALLRDAIFHLDEDVSLNLIMQYVPYSRQDRVCYEGEAFSLSVFIDFINKLNFNSILISDPHSKVTEKLLFDCDKNNRADMGGVCNWWITPLKKLLPRNTLIIAPDKGAENRVHEFAHCSEGILFESIICDKIRNPENGWITSYSVPKCDFDKYECLLVLDDICDGGATFNILADAINHQNKWLFVTHGIFSKGILELKKRYKKIISTDSLLSSNKDDVIILTYI